MLNDPSKDDIAVKPQKYPFDQFPRNIYRDPDFKKLTAVECKLLFYLFGRRSWIDNKVPIIGLSLLAPMIGTNRHRLVDAIRNLTFMGYIDCLQLKRKYAIKVIFQDRGALIKLNPKDRIISLTTTATP